MRTIQCIVATRSVIDAQDVKQLLETGPVCPDSIQAMQLYLKQQASADCSGNVESQKPVADLQPAA